MASRLLRDHRAHKSKSDLERLGARTWKLVFCTLAFAVCLAASMLVSPRGALADENSSVTGVTLGDGFVVYTTDSVDQTSVPDEALARVKYWRQDALNDKNIKLKYKSTYYTVPEYLQRIGMSEEEYLNPTWSNSLERIAVQRVVENRDSSRVHIRLNGDKPWTAKYDDHATCGEVLAWGAGKIQYSIDMWAHEKNEYIKEINNESHGVTGHYTFLINPFYKEYGFAVCDTVAAGEGNGYYASYNDPDHFNLQGTFDFPVSVTSDELDQGVDSNVPETIAEGSSFSPTATLRFTTRKFYYGEDTYQVHGTWSSSNPSVLAVSSDGSVRAVGEGTATLTLSSQGKTWSFPATVKSTVPMYRLYNRWSGEHLFTTDYSEYSYLASIGWSQEGVAWNAPASGGTPVWRLYNPYSGDHLYTGDASEYAYLATIGWRQEGEAFRSADPSSGGAPIYRLYNRWLTAGTHLFTTDASEYSYLGTLGWSQEGKVFYAAK